MKLSLAQTSPGGIRKMLIDRGKGFIFVHVPKTGGQSIANALGVPQDNPQAIHAPLFSVPIEAKKYWSFGVARNPFDRLVSLYHFMCQKNMKATDNFSQKVVNEMGFKNWLMYDEFYMAEDKPFMDSVDHLLPPMQRRPQSWWLRGCDAVVIFNQLEYGLNAAFMKAGLGQLRLPHINKSNHDDWRSCYDDEMRAFVLKYHAEDFENFGFTQ